VHVDVTSLYAHTHTLTAVVGAQIFGLHIPVQTIDFDGITRISNHDVINRRGPADDNAGVVPNLYMQPGFFLTHNRHSVFGVENEEFKSQVVNWLCFDERLNGEWNRYSKAAGNIIIIRREIQQVYPSTRGI
jgi:hypothetical protein